MSKTGFSSSDAIAKKVWEEQLWRDTVKEAYFSRFMGKTSANAVMTKDELAKTKGDTVNFQLRMRLEGEGVTGNQTLEGNEEDLKLHNCQVSLERYRHAVRDNGEMSRQRVAFSIDAESEQAIQDWGSEKITKLCMNELFSTTSTKMFYGGSASSTATLTADDKITPELISKVKAWARTGGNRSYVPLRPIMVDGKKYLVLLTHDDALFDLKRNAEFIQAMREAEIRGKENPLFSGAYAIYDGLVIHTHEDVPIYTNWGAGADVAGVYSCVFGAQSLVWANGKRGEVIARDFDYGEEHGYAYAMTCKAKKPIFDSKAYGSLLIATARTQIADA